MSEVILYERIPTDALRLSAEELSARLRTPLGYRDVTVDALEQELRHTICAAMTAVRVPILRKGDHALDLSAFSVESAALTKALSDCDEAYLLAVTLGMQTERWLHRLSILSPAKHFTADALASAYAEAAADVATEQLAKKNLLTNRFSPGYGDLPLEIQPQMLAITGARRHLGITLSDSFLMIPQKSITAILGICPRPDQGETI